MSERVALFVDGGNLYHAMKVDFNNQKKLNFEKFAHKLAGDRQLFRVYYYSVLPKQHDDPAKYSKQQRFLDSLDHIPYFDVHIGRLIKQGDVSKEEGIDVTLAVDMLEMAFVDAYDTAILISGDGDLAYAVSAVKRFGKHVENVVTPHNSSHSLRKICDRVLILTEEFLGDCWISE